MYTQKPRSEAHGHKFYVKVIRLFAQLLFHEKQHNYVLLLYAVNVIGNFFTQRACNVEEFSCNLIIMFVDQWTFPCLTLVHHSFRSPWPNACIHIIISSFSWQMAAVVNPAIMEVRVATWRNPWSFIVPASTDGRETYAQSVGHNFFYNVSFTNPNSLHYIRSWN